MKKIIFGGPILIIFSAILWSLDGLLRRSLFVLPPLTIVFWEHALGFALLLPLLVGQIRSIGRIAPKTWGALVWVTALSSIAGTLFYTAALGQVHYIQFSVVVLLQQTQPLFVVLFSWFVLKERMKKSFPVWLVLGLFGAYLISFPSLTVQWESGKQTVFAALLAIGAAFCWGSSTAFSRYALLRLPAIVVTGMRFGLASLMALALSIPMGTMRTLGTLNMSQWWTLLVISLSTGMVALAIYYFGLKKTPAWISSVCELTWPLSAITIDYVWFHKSLTASQWIGSGLLLVSIFWVSRMQFHKKDESAAVLL